MNYAVFGGCLQSDLPVPELPVVTDVAPDWTFATITRRAARPLIFLGEDRVTDAVRVRLYRHAGGYQLLFDDTGCFDVSRNGSSIVWSAPPDVSLNAVRLDLLGRVLALAAHASGILCLHGSAVACGSEGIVFLAPKFHGKSTMAAALARAGASVLADDTVPVEPGPPALLRPGVPAVRLWRDAAHQLGDGLAVLDGSHGAKALFSQGRRHDARQGCPLAAIYLLQPVMPDSVPPVRRVPVPPVAAALAIVEHARLGPLLRGPEAGTVLAMAAALARSTPVFAMQVARSFDRLPDVVTTLSGWHAFTPAEAVAPC